MGVDDASKDYIEKEIMPPAISYYEAALQVKRLQENLKVEKKCRPYNPSEYLILEGVPADFLILVAAINDTEIKFVATATPCEQSVVDDRPVYGLLTFNFAYIVMNKIADDQENLSIALHEMIHLLSFNSNFYKYYRHYETGEPLTGHIRTKEVNGATVYYIEVEPLTTKLRDYFGCPTLEGAYLENEGESLSTGSHFERRIFMNEFMTASSITEPVISEFTLALLEGTGWYQVNYNMTEPFNWGRGKGCAFLDGPCINNQGEPNFEEFCNTNFQKDYTFTSRAIGFCGSSDFNDTFADNCPYYTSNARFDCENTANQEFAFFEEEIYGPNSRCFTGTLTKPELLQGPRAFCMPTKCEQSHNGSSCHYKC